MDSLQRKYTVKEQLGKGSYATVFRVVDKITSDEFAVKVMDKQRLGEKGIKQVKGEIEIMQALSHPNIIKCIEVIEDRAHYCIIMELLEGGELFKRITKLRHYSERTACMLMRGFLRVLEYMHAEGVCHRDLKPDNLLLKESAEDKQMGVEEVTRVKVADFGFACRFRGQQLAQACGTPYYIAPELLETGVYKTQSFYTPPPCDMWSTGVIMYVLLCGYPPFRVARDVPDAKGKLFRQIRRGKIVFDRGQAWDRISDEAKDLVLRMLTTRPEDRITAAQALDHAWFLQQGVNDEHLSESVEEMKDFDAKTKIKGAVYGVEAAFRLIYSDACDRWNNGKKNSSLIDTLASATEPLREIDLTGNYLGPKGIDALISIINHHETLTSLNLNNCLIDTDQCVKLCRVLQDPQTHSRITVLDLSMNPLTHPAGRALLTMLQQRRRITRINLDGTYIRPELVKKITDQAARNSDMPCTGSTPYSVRAGRGAANGRQSLSGASPGRSPAGSGAAAARSSQQGRSPVSHVSSAPRPAPGSLPPVSRPAPPARPSLGR